NGPFEDRPAEELERPYHLQVVTGAAPDQWHLGAQDAVGAAHDLLLVTAKAVAQDQQHAVRAVTDLCRGAGDISACAAQSDVAGEGGRGGARAPHPAARP